MDTESKHQHRIYGDRFIVKRRISAGSFGVVYLCADQQSKDYVALKVEKDIDDNNMSLEREIEILESLQNIEGIPRLIWYGNENNQNCLALQLLGRDLAYYLKHFKKFSLKCVVNIADQVLNVLEAVHKRGIIHRDIKPENLITGRDDEQGMVYLVDFGISKFYKDEKGQHISFQTNKAFIGTTRYASLGAHQGYELGRKDDLESLGYVLIYFLKGVLPWQNIVGNSEKEKAKLVGQTKEKIQLNELCKDLPSEFQKYINYVRNLQFKSNPDYKYLQQLFMKIAVSNNFQIDQKLDWTENNGTTKKKLNKQNSIVSEKKQKKLDKKNTFNDMSSIGSYNVLKEKTFQRQGTNSSQQSSIFLNYAPSIQQPKIRSKLFNRIEQRLTFQQHIKSSQDIGSKRMSLDPGAVDSYNSKENILSKKKEDNILPQGEGFQDLEALELRQRNKSKQIGEVKKVTPKPQRELSISKDLIDDFEESLGTKLDKINKSQPQRKFKSKLAKY